MNPLQIIFIIGLAIVVSKFAASMFGYGNIPILNVSVSFILISFIVFEVVQLVRVMLVSFG
ncbi:MAG: hypothetical protein WA919_26625 [Coleofasciculaceae cyanobacterium]